ncbi:MAG: SprB repeat-containing protein, partial [Bacteroidota bacterium]
MILNSNNPICENDNIYLSASGGTTYQWTGPNGFSSMDKNPIIPNANPSMSGTYTVLVSDLNGCETTESIDISVGEEVSADYTPFHATCDDLGAIEVGIIGGTPPYTFDWADLVGNDDPRDRDNLEPGIYSLTITDAGGCTATMLNIPIADHCTECDVAAGTITADWSPVCLDPNGPTSISATHDNNMYVPDGFTFTFFLATGNGLIILDQNGASSFDVNEAGTYTIHTLVYDTTTLDLDFIDFGNSSLFEINSLIIQGGGDICASLDLAGATIEVTTIEVVIEDTTADNCNLGVGMASLSPTNYTYAWSDGGTGADRSNLSEGTYTVTATDPNSGCQGMINVTIDGDCICIEPEIASVDVAPSTCGNGNGTATVLVDGNPADYQYSWSANANTGTPNAIGNEVDGLFAGIYTVTVSFPQVANCVTVQTFTIGNIDGPVLDSIATTPAECQAANGSATLYPNTYVYRWTIDNFTGNTRSDLAAGTYHIVIINPLAPSCPNVISIDIESENNLVGTVDIIEQPDCQAANGTVQIQVPDNGGMTYTYNWNDNPTANTAYRDDLPARDYTVIVTEQSPAACETTISFSLEEKMQGATLTILPGLTTSCPGSNDGTVDYTIDYDPGFATPAAISIEDTLGNKYANGELLPGYYCVVVEDANDCLATRECFEIMEPMGMSIDANITAADCIDKGAIDLTVSGGTGGYSYNWSDLPGSNDPEDRTDLDAGTYIVTLTDANGCTAVNFNLIVDDLCNICDAPQVTNILVVEASCGETNGSIAIETVEPATDYLYTWSPNVGNGAVLTGLAAGTYEVTISNRLDTDCFVTETITLGNIDGPVANIVLNSPATCTAADGQAILSPATYTYTWSDGATGATRTDLTAGDYTITVLDPNTACFDILSLTIDATSPMTALVSIDQQPTCGEANGIVSISTTGGSGNYNYTWNAGATKNNLSAGSYTITVTDNDTGCEAIVNFTLSDDVAAATITIDETVAVSCAGEGDGSVLYTIDYAPGFVDDASIQIEDAVGNTYLSNSLPEGTYCIVVRDGNACLAGQTCFDITAPTAINIEVVIGDQDCATQGSIAVTATGGNGNYTYDWADLTGTANPEDRTDLTAGFYSLTVTDAMGCSAIANDLLIANTCTPCDPPEVNNATIVEATCGIDNGSIQLQLAGNPNDYSYTWTPNVGNGYILTNLPAGTYSLRVAWLSDPSCFTEISYVLGSIDGPQANVQSTTAANCNAADGQAILSPNFYSYTWSDGGSGTSRNDLIAGTYQVTVTDNAAGCSDIMELTIDEQSNLVAIPNVNIQPTCGEANGAVTITVTNGTGNYTYSWGTGNVKTDLLAGSYEVTVLDTETGCEAIASFNLIDDVAGASINISPNVALDCPGDFNATVDYTIDYDPGFSYPERIEIRDNVGNTYINGAL